MTDHKSALILIVDDDYDFLEINRLILERAGYRVATAAEPQQALQLMEEEKPDLVITDLMMTSLDSGFLFARTIKQDPRYAGTPVIIATSVSSALGLDFSPRTEEDRAHMHADAYFDKPLDSAQLLATIAELLGRAAAHKRPPAAAPGSADERAPGAPRGSAPRSAARGAAPDGPPEN
jgi:CheY-like chemotaxis protein